MAKEKNIVEPISGSFDEVANALVQQDASMQPKEITTNANKINILAAKSTGKEITPFQKAKEIAVDSLQDTANEIARSCDEYCTFEMARVGLSAALAALESHGYVLLPAKHNGVAGLSPEMCTAFWGAYDKASSKHGHFESTNAGYNAMLNAAKAER